LSKMARVVRVLTFGDSLTAGYTGGYSAQFHPYADFIKSKSLQLECDVIGMSGWTSGQMVENCGRGSDAKIMTTHAPTPRAYKILNFQVWIFLLLNIHICTQT